MKIGHLIVCDNAGKVEDGRRLLINPRVTISVDDLKSNIEFAVSVGLYDISSNSFTLTVEIYDPDNNLISRKESEHIEVGPLGDDKNDVYSASVNIKFKEVLIQKKGKYLVKALVRGEEKELVLPINLRAKKDVE